MNLCTQSNASNKLTTINSLHKHVKLSTGHFKLYQIKFTFVNFDFEVNQRFTRGPDDPLQITRQSPRLHVTSKLQHMFDERANAQHGHAAAGSQRLRIQDQNCTILFKVAFDRRSHGTARLVDAVVDRRTTNLDVVGGVTKTVQIATDASIRLVADSHTLNTGRLDSTRLIRNDDRLLFILGSVAVSFQRDI